MKNPHYGWVVVAALSITETVSWGIVYYGFPIMLRPMEQDLGYSRTALTAAFSLGLAVAAIVAIPVGRWIDRRGARVVMTVGACLNAILLVGWARVDSLPWLYLVWGGLGLGMATTLYEPGFAAIVGWFTGKHRDRALLIVTLAGGLASTIFVPIETWLLARMSWRDALLVLAAIVAVLTIPIHALALRAPPHLSRAKSAGHDGTAIPGVPLRTALRTVVFWVLEVAFFAANFATVVVTVHLIPYLSERGYSPAVAALMIGWMGAVQLFGRALFAPVVSVLGHRSLTAAVFVAQAAGFVLLALAGRLPTMIPTVILLGAANGMATLARATVVAEIFGPRHYGSIGGAIALGTNGARASAPVAAALLQVALGGYETLFWALAGLLVVAGVAVRLTEPPAG
ncbi:MAG: MFS transporter [Candidatus Rokuibacteriota bacterium]